MVGHDGRPRLYCLPRRPHGFFRFFFFASYLFLCDGQSFRVFFSPSIPLSVPFFFFFFFFFKSAGKTADKLSDAVTSLYFPAKHHQGKVMDFIEANNGLHDGCPVAGMHGETCRYLSVY